MFHHEVGLIDREDSDERPEGKMAPNNDTSANLDASQSCQAGKATSTSASAGTTSYDVPPVHPGDLGAARRLSLCPPGMPRVLSAAGASCCGFWPRPALRRAVLSVFAVICRPGASRSSRGGRVLTALDRIAASRAPLCPVLRENASFIGECLGLRHVFHAG